MKYWIAKATGSDSRFTVMGTLNKKGAGNSYVLGGHYYCRRWVVKLEDGDDDCILISKELYKFFYKKYVKEKKLYYD